jgi:gliding motility-associated-like protein
MKFTLTLFALIAATMLCGQKYLTSFGAPNNDEALSIALDNSGSSYSTGYFNNTITYQSTSFSSNGFTDVFVVKTSALGIAEWAFSGGSTGPDRGLAIDVHTDGSTAVTGYYSNNASFGSTVLTANALSQDLFVLKLNANGSVAWAKGFGSSMSDTGFGITFDNTGNILVTGQFRGTINFDGIIFTSTPLPDDEGPSYDTFILKLDPNGTVLWAKQGKNSDESKGLDIKTDNLGNVFVCGQFSDTLTFDVSHPNLILNAAFVVKFDPDGNELWFRHFTSTQTSAYGMDVTANGELYVTGDNIGPLIFFANGTAQLFNVDYTFNIYLAKFNSAGTLQWLQTNGSENSVSSRAVAIDEEEQPYITGTFRCQFEEYGLEYDTGIFFSAGYRDVFISKFSSTGERIWSRHLASTGDSFCSAIAINQPNNPLICGSFETIFVVPESLNSFENIPGSLTGSFNPPLCGDSNYGRFRRVNAIGAKDVFISAPIVLPRLPLDYFTRASGVCERPYREPCVHNCEDSLIHCGPVSVAYNDYTISILKPLANIEWFGVNTGPVTNFSVPESDTYIMNYTRLDGCISFSDTLHAIIHPVPFPLLTDSEGYNLDQTPTASNDILICFPDTAIIMVENFAETDSIWWSATITSNIIPMQVDTAIMANQNGTFFFNVQNEFGCYNYNQAHVYVFYPINDPDVVITFPSFPNPVDTISVCQNTLILGDLLSATGEPDVIQFILDNATVTWSISPESANIGTGAAPSSFQISTNTSGYYTITCIIDAECEFNLTFIELTVYINIYPAAQFNLSITGVNDICPDDFTILTATGSDNFVWNGPEFIQLSYNSIQAWQPGVYSVFATGISEFGCPGSATQSFTLAYRPPPVITMLPASGIICPEDSVLLIAEEGIAYQWLGPVGQLLGTTQSIYTTEPGFYSCIVTDYDDCTLESNFLEVITYSSPYLVTIPFSDLCLTGSVQLAAVTHPSATVQWNAPISSTAPTVTVTEPGVYTGSVTLCGITTTQSVTVIETLVNAFIDIAGPPVICNGDSIQLLGNIGMLGYQWLPGSQQTTNIWITQPGEYQLLTWDEQGCQGTSIPIVITEVPAVSLNLSNNEILCPPDSIFLTASGEFTSFIWLPNGETTSEIWINEAGIYQVVATDNLGCTSTSEAIEITEGNSPFVPQVSDLIHCAGNDFSILIQTSDSVFWLSADGPFYANPLQMLALSNDTLLQFFVVSSDGCISPTQNFIVQVIDGNFTPEIIGPEVICAGDTISLFTTPITDANYQWLINDVLYSSDSQLIISETSQLVNPTSITLIVVVEECAVGQQFTTIQILPIPSPLTINGQNNVCNNESVMLYTEADNNLLLNWQWLNNSSSSDTIQFSLNPGDSVLVSLTTELNGCSSIATEQWVFAHLSPQIADIFSNSPVCEGETITINVVTNEITNTTITSPQGIEYESNTIEISNADLNNDGYYLVQVSNMYCNTTDSINIQIFPVPYVELGGDVTLCAGETYFFNIEEHEIVIWNENVVSNTYQTIQNEVVSVSVINIYGCSYVDSVTVSFLECDGPISNIFTPNGDGVNDLFYFNQYEYKDLQVFIYNRWGQLICKMNNIDYWDGNNCKTGLKVSDGTYFYVMNYITRESEHGMKKGYIQVSR